MKRVIWLAGLIVVVVGIALLDHHPPPVSAGGWPCFLCHGGFDVVGTDIAPPLAGSRLTDEQIIAQVRKPRGMMPVYSREELADEFLKNGFINVFVRGKPTGQPTATLSAENRAIALATIAAVAATRSVEYTRLTGSVAIETPTPMPRMPTPAASPTPTVGAGPRDSSFSFGASAAIGGFIIAMLAAVRLWMRR